MSARSLRLAVLLIWLLCAATLIIDDQNYIRHFYLRDADDALRLVEVRDWMAGQSWFDVGQYRIHPPGGVPMHWSRLVDIPIAAFIALFSLLGFEPLPAERITLVLVPLLLLLSLFAALAALTFRLTQDRLKAVVAAAMLTLSFGVLIQFRPMRIDHHGWQILLDTLATLFIVGATRHAPRRALWAGVTMAVSLIIALEGLPLAVTMAGIVAVRYLRDPAERVVLQGYMLGLVGGCLLLLAVMLGWPGAGLFWCDSLSPAYAVPMATALAIVLVAPRVLGDATLTRRLATLILVGLGGGLVFVLHSHQCIAGPFGTLDPLVYKVWYRSVSEGMPVWTQEIDVAIIIPLQGAVGLIGTALAIRFAPVRQRDGWMAMFILQLVSFAISLVVLRAMGIAHILALPGAAWLFMTALRSTRALASPPLRIVLGCACFFVTPVGVEVVANMAFVPKSVREKPNDDRLDARITCVDRDSLRGLAALPPATLFAALDIGPHIVAFTPHSVIGTGHHRNVEGMREVISAFIAPPDKARQIIARTPATYLVFCNRDNEVQKFTTINSRSLMADLARGRTPAWLTPVPMRKGERISVYRILQPDQAPDQAGVKRSATPFMQ